MLKIIEKKLETLPINTPLAEVRIFVDKCMHDLWKMDNGRTNETIRKGHAIRTSV